MLVKSGHEFQYERNETWLRDQSGSVRRTPGVWVVYVRTESQREDTLWTGRGP